MTGGLDVVFARMAARHPHGFQVLHQRIDGELVIDWMNSHEAARLGVPLDSTPVELRSIAPSTYPAWCAVFREAISSGTAERVIDGSLVTLVAVADARVAVETRRLARTELPLPTEHALMFEKLFAQNVAGMFVMVLDTPLEWNGSVDREILLDEAFEHLRLTAVNEVMCEQLAEPRDRLIGTVPRDRWRERRTEWREYMTQLYDRGHVHHTVNAPRSDGTSLLVEGEYMCTYDERGRITGHLGTQRDVTEKYRILSELAASRERLELAMLGCDLGVWDLDLATERFVFEGSLLDRFGYAQRTDSTEWWRERVHPADRAALDVAFEEHVAGRRPVYHVECRVQTVTGQWMWVMSTGRVSGRMPDGRPSRVVGMCLDITDRHRLQEHIAATERLVALGTLAAGVGHEINNPLTYVLLGLELVERGLGQKPVEELQQLVVSAREGAERVRRIVHNLRVLSRPRGEHLTTIDPVGVIERCLEIVQQEGGHRARVERQLAAIPTIRADEARLFHLFQNLIINAVDAIRDLDAHSGLIKIATGTTPDGQAIIEISDNGVGVSSDMLPHIFDPFFTNRSLGDGTGLRLAIVGAIVRDMAGEIEVESTVGGGSTFRLRFPSASNPAPSSGRPAPVPLPRISRRLRILVIDDDVGVASSLVRILDEHDVTAETSAHAALGRLAAGERFDAIICDLMMPELSGIELYDRLGAIDPELRSLVVFVTGGAFTRTAREFLERIENPRLDKPIDVDELVATLARLTVNRGDRDGS